MQKNNSIQFTTQIVFFSMLTVLFEFLLHSFVQMPFLTFGISTLLLVSFSHHFVFRSFSFESAFLYSLLCVLMSGFVTFCEFIMKENELLLFESVSFYIVLLNFFLPMIYCILRCLFDHNNRYRNFKEFFRNSSILFFIGHCTIFVSVQFLQYTNAFKGTTLQTCLSQPHIICEAVQNINAIPFLTFAERIESYIYQTLPLSYVISYVVSPLLLYLPLGFIIHLLLRYQSRLLRIFLFLLLPIAVEFLQYTTLHLNAEVDDIIFAVFGQLLGSLLYFFINSLFLRIKDEDFLEARQYGHQSHLHF